MSRSCTTLLPVAQWLLTSSGRLDGSPRTLGHFYLSQLQVMEHNPAVMGMLVSRDRPRYKECYRCGAHFNWLLYLITRQVRAVRP